MRNYSTVSPESGFRLHTHIHEVLPRAFTCAGNGCAQLRFKFYDLLNLNYTTPIKWDRARSPRDCQVLHSVFQPSSLLTLSVSLYALCIPTAFCLRLCSKTTRLPSNLVYRQKSTKRMLIFVRWKRLFN